MDAFFFYAFALLTVAGAVATVTFKNAVHSAVSLIGSLLGAAGLYLLQKAEFLFAVQIILYIGGIMLLFLFVIMLVNLDLAEKQRQFNRQGWIALACVLGIAIEAVFYVRSTAAVSPWSSPVPTPAGGNTERLADVLFSEYLLPFEIVSILLLVAVVGSVFMAKKRNAAETAE